MSSYVASSATQRSEGLSLRSLVRSDVPAIQELLRANQPTFSDDECRTAIEMIEETLDRPPSPDPYQFLVAAQTGAGPDAGTDVLCGYACFGTVPLTRGTYDLYWIAVRPELHGRGIGLTLMQAVEDVIAEQGGRLIMIETATRNGESSRRLYGRAGYEVAARIRDFYEPGDDKFLFMKYVCARSGGPEPRSSAT